MRMPTIAIVFMASITVHASACVVAEPNLTFEQWHRYCAAEIDQTCSNPPFKIFPDCSDSIARAMYRTYADSQSFPPCGQNNPGEAMCINGYVSTCNGAQWMTGSLRC